jgi:hypothetical protein
VINYIIDGIFFVDILIIFNTAIYGDDFEMVKDRSLIAYDYITTWFFLDFFTILPFDLMFNGGGNSMNNLLRMARIGRINKILKLLKLIKLMKMQKQSSSSTFAFL